MLNKILVPLDGSELAEGALAFATGLSIPTAAQILLVRAVSVHAFPGVDVREPQVRALAEAEIYLREMAEDLTERGFVVEIATPYGESPADWIVEETTLRHADLIVMSTHGRTGPGRWMFGSVAEAVVSRSPVPVLVQRAWDLAERQLLLEDRPRLLVPLDGSAFSESVLDLAARLAEDVGGELVLVRVVTTPRDVLNAEEDVAVYLDELDTAERTTAQNYLLDVSAELSQRWPIVSVSTTVQFGQPDVGIAAAAAESRAAMVVMATHGRTGLRRATLGSVAGRVLEHGHTPLVLAHPH
jgi:nucleotide-binding universal stress UspA family protein